MVVETSIARVDTLIPMAGQSLDGGFESGAVAFDGAIWLPEMRKMSNRSIP